MMKWLKRFFKGEGYLQPALDIGSYSVKVVQLARTPQGYSLQKYGLEEYSEPVFAGGEIVDDIEVVDAIRRLFLNLGIEDEEVTIHIPMASCFYSVVSLSPSSNLKDSVMEYIRSIIGPEEFPKVEIAYEVLPYSLKEGSVSVAIAAVKKEALKRRLELVKRAGLEPSVVDIEVGAINNQYYLNNPDKVSEPVCLVDMGYSSTKVVVSVGGFPFLARDFEYGGAWLSEQIQRELSVDFESAEALKREGSPRIEELLYRFLKRVGTEVRWTLDDFKERFEKEVEQIFLYGGVAKMGGVASLLSDLVEGKVSVGAPLSFASLSGHEEFAVAAGLALRYEGDENASF